MKERTSPAAGA